MSTDLQPNNDQQDKLDEKKSNTKSDSPKVKDSNTDYEDDSIFEKKESVGFVDEGVVVPPEQLEQLKHLAVRPSGAEVDPSASIQKKAPKFVPNKPQSNRPSMEDLEIYRLVFELFDRQNKGIIS